MQSRADMIVIFNLRFRQRGFFNRAPHHGAQPAIERPIHQKLADLPGNRGFRGEIHGRVAIRPITGDTKPDEFLPLYLQPMFGIGAAFGAEIQHRHRILVAALIAVFFFNLPFNRQAVAIPAGDVIRIIPRHLRGTIDHILQNFIQRMADMQIAIGIGRAIMQHEALTPLGLGAEPFPQFQAVPACQRIGFALRQIAAHGKAGLRQEDGAAIIAGLFGSIGHFFEPCGLNAGCRVGRPG